MEPRDNGEWNDPNDRRWGSIYGAWKIDHDILNSIYDPEVRTRLREIMNNPAEREQLGNALNNSGSNVDQLLDNVRDELTLRERIRGWESLIVFITVSVSMVLLARYDALINRAENDPIAADQLLRAIDVVEQGRQRSQVAPIA